MPSIQQMNWNSAGLGNIGSTSTTSGSNVADQYVQVQ